MVRPGAGTTADTAARTCGWAIWLLFIYEIAYATVVPVEPGFTNIHLAWHVLFLSAVGLLIIGGWQGYKARGRCGFSTRSLLIWGGLLVWGLISATVFLKGDFREVGYGLVSPSTVAVSIVPLGFLVGGQIAVWHRLLGIASRQLFIGVALVVGLVVWDLVYLRRSVGDLNVLYAAPVLLVCVVAGGQILRTVDVVGFGIWVSVQVLFGIRSGVFRSVVVVGLVFAVLLMRFVRGDRRSAPLAVIGMLLLGTVAGISQMRVSSDPILFERGRLGIEKLRFGEDSRSWLAREFFEAMPATSVLLGSPTGKYFSPVMGIERPEVEIGWLHMILRTGVVGLSLFLVLSLTAVWRGLRRGLSDFRCFAALIVLERLLWMFPYGVPFADCGYVFFWMAVGACHAGESTTGAASRQGASAWTIRTSRRPISRQVPPPSYTAGAVAEGRSRQREEDSA